MVRPEAGRPGALCAPASLVGTLPSYQPEAPQTDSALTVDQLSPFCICSPSPGPTPC